jgi:hypothetical protein
MTVVPQAGAPFHMLKQIHPVISGAATGPFRFCAVNSWYGDTWAVENHFSGMVPITLLRNHLITGFAIGQRKARFEQRHQQQDVEQTRSFRHSPEGKYMHVKALAFVNLLIKNNLLKLSKINSMVNSPLLVIL